MRKGNKTQGIILQIIFYLFFFNTFAYPHLCDNVFRQADKLIVKPENYNMVVKDKATFKIFLQNNMDRGIAEISLIADSPVFDFTITPEKMTVPKDQRVFFTVTMRPKPKVRTGYYPINFRLVGGGRQFKSFNLDVQGGDAAVGSSADREKAVEKKIEKAEDTSRLLRVKPAGESPVIDGALDDRCWKEAAVASNFSSEKGGKAVSETVALITFDKDSLYFSAYCSDEDIKKLSTQDTVEIWFTPDDSGYPFYSITLSATGSTRFKKSPGKGRTLVYKPEGIRYCIASDKDYWTAEVSIPFSVLEIAPPAREAVWYMRIIRTKAAGEKEMSYWAQDSSGYNSEDGFGAFVIGP